MEKYFTGCYCAEELKEQYFKLVMVHHPDKGGDLEVMKAINNQYDAMFANLKDIHRSIKPGSEEKYYTAKAGTNEAPADFRHIIMVLVSLQGVNVELVGRWVWITGDTKQHKDALKGLGCSWAPKKMAWSWHYPEDACTSRGKKSLDDIRSAYGTISYATSDQLQLVSGA